MGLGAAAAVWAGTTRAAEPAPAGRAVYVAPGGSDANPGALEKPLATPARAQAWVREARKAAGGPVAVYLRGGTYRLPQPLVFTPEDSGTKEAPAVWQAYPGEEAVLTGSVAVQAEWKPYRGGVWVCSLKGTPLQGVVFNQLFCNGRRMIRARYPNWDFEDPLRTGKGYLHVADGGLDHLVWEKGDLDGKSWSRPDQAVVHVFHSHNWGNMQYRIKSIDKAARRIQFGEGGWQCQRRVGPGRTRGEGSPYYIENLFEELDAPHEWYLDAEKQALYFYPPPGVDLRQAVVEAAVLKRLVEFRGSPKQPVHDIHLKGLALRQTQATFMDRYDDLARGDWAVHRGGAVYLTGVEDCRFDDGRVAQVGGNGLFVDGYARRVHVAGCLFEDLGDSAVCFVGRPEAVREYQTWESKVRQIKDLAPGPKTDDYPAECSVRNCILRDVGVYGKQTSGVLVSMSRDITVSHCTIHRIPRAGVTFNDGTWGGHVLEYCDIWDTVQDTGEHGPFNAWGRERFWSSKKKEWVLLDALKPVVIRYNRIANYRKGVSAGNWTIDLDDGSSNYEIYNNLSLGSTLKLRDGFHRKVWNNIHVSAVPLGWHCWPKESEDEFFHNITVVAGARPGGDAPEALLIRPASMPPLDKQRWGKRIDENLYYNFNTRAFAVGDQSRDWNAWQRLGYDAHSVFADPLFADPRHGDFRVRDGSPALKIGFQNFPMDQFGHQMTRIEPLGGPFQDEIRVTLKPDARGGQAYYTTDGSEPVPASARYDAPVALRATTTLKARTFKDGRPVGFTESAVFTKVAKVALPGWLDTVVRGGLAGGTVTQARPAGYVWLGARLVSLADDPDLIDASGGQGSGAYVVEAPEKSEANRLGFRAADIVQKVGNQDVRTAGDLERIIKTPPARPFTVEVIREKQRLRIEVR